MKKLNDQELFDVTPHDKPDNTILSVLRIISASCPVPYLNLISQTLSELEARRQQCFLNKLDERIKFLEQESRHKFMIELNSDNGKKLITYSLGKAKNCYVEEQFEKISEVITKALAEDLIHPNDAEVLIDIISDLNDAEAKALREIYAHMKEINSDTNDICKWKYNKNDDFGIPQGFIHRLIGKGLLVESHINRDAFWANGLEAVDFFYSYSYYGILFTKHISQYL